MLLEFTDKPLQSRSNNSTRRRFYFENCWAVDDECQNLISSVWGGCDNNGNLQNMLGRISTSGLKLDAWNAQKRNQQRHNIKSNRRALKEATAGNGTYNWDSIRRIENKLDDALETEENYWHQRAKADWMAKGDRNSSFFHAKASGRRARNRIAGLRNDSGVWKDSNEDLASIISAYFSGLYTSSFPSSQDLEKVTKNVNTKLSLQKENDKLQGILLQSFSFYKQKQEALPSSYCNFTTCIRRNWHCRRSELQEKLRQGNLGGISRDPQNLLWQHKISELCYSSIAAVPEAAKKVTSQKDVIELSLNLTTTAVEHNFFQIKKL
ncbi:hypothetical protein LWI29_017686 [Acer saccharum]|uniref:Uncharacterized protein n=1 Tax=Acer saccharum TaxID=4024 RepID=A0AA39SUB9_ACESA|nr:hypothetical protein LWI29_017686 [Acer saccharum]